MRRGAATGEASDPGACLLAAIDLGGISPWPGHPNRATDTVREKQRCDFNLSSEAFVSRQQSTAVNDFSLDHKRKYYFSPTGKSLNALLKQTQIWPTCPGDT